MGRTKVVDVGDSRRQVEYKENSFGPVVCGAINDRCWSVIATASQEKQEEFWNAVEQRFGSEYSTSRKTYAKEIHTRLIPMIHSVIGESYSSLLFPKGTELTPENPLRIARTLMEFYNLSHKLTDARSRELLIRFMEGKLMQGVKIGKPVALNLRLIANARSVDRIPDEIADYYGASRDAMPSKGDLSVKERNEIRKQNESKGMQYWWQEVSSFSRSSLTSFHLLQPKSYEYAPLYAEALGVTPQIALTLTRKDKAAFIGDDADAEWMTTLYSILPDNAQEMVLGMLRGMSNSLETTIHLA